MKDYYLLGYLACLSTVGLVSITYNQGVLNISFVETGLVDGIDAVSKKASEKSAEVATLVEKIEAFFRPAGSQGHSTE